MIARLRSNRTLSCLPEPGSSRTRPRWYGQKFKLNDATTWPPAYQHDWVTLTHRQDQPTTLKLSRWHNLIMRGNRDYPMQRYPFDVLCVQRVGPDAQPQGTLLWLLIWGAQRHQFTSPQSQQVDRQRFCIEHFFGFAKPHLLLTASQTCRTDHEINAVRLAALAYVQLWLARRLVDSLPLPWQRYLPHAKTQQLTPRQVQRGFTQLMQQLGSIARPPKTRGIPPRRLTGTRLPPRSPCPLVKFHPPRKLCPCKDSQDVA